MDKSGLPETLREAIVYFSDPDVCESFVAALRWPDGPICPRCGGREHYRVSTRRLWRCKSCKREFTGTGGKDKVAVLGVLTRGGRVQAHIVPDTKRRTLQEMVRESVVPGSNIYTDALGSYVGLGEDYTHEVVDHAREYVDGKVHTN